MIKIDKTPIVPQTLANAPTPQDAVSVSDKIYKAEDVRTTLLDDQHNKCAYCEMYVEGSYSDVEHFRPKSSYRRLRTDRKSRKPGYHTLAYRWDNLLYACNVCNRSLKNDFFPLKDESKRLVVADEKPLLINPAIEDPALYIQYNRYMPMPVISNGKEDARGKETIELFQLVKRHLSQRKELWDMYESKNRQSVQLSQLIGDKRISNDMKIALQQVKDSILQDMMKLKSPSTPFSGMFVRNIANI